MTKKEFLKRCETIYDLGLVGNKDRRQSSLLRSVVDAVMRFEGGQRDNHQMSYWTDFVEMEKLRTKEWKKVLAGDTELYGLIQMACILDHPCQKCAEDLNAWHTRYGFCNHKETL